MDIKLSLSKSELISYVESQLGTFFPDGKSIRGLDSVISNALQYLAACINSAKLWTPGHFSHLHSSQYCIFLYWLAREGFLNGLPRETCDKLFFLNKALNGIDLFYEIEMPQRFFIGHTNGIVLCKAEYGDKLVLYQNTTIGKNNGTAPVIGPCTIIYPHSSIVGACIIGENTTISHGCRLTDCSTRGNCLVFGGSKTKKPITRKAKRVYIDDYFRN
jgi:serine O-acetyltransferase